MKRLSLLLIILLIGCADPIDDFDIHVTSEAQEIPKLASDQWNMKEALTNSELKEAIPEFLGSLNIESNVVHEQTSGITVGWTPIIKGRSVNALLLTTGKKDNWQHKLIMKELLEEYYKRSPKHNGPPKEAIRQAFEFHQRQIAPSGTKKINSARINTHKGQINQDGYDQEKISNGEFIEICGYQLAYSYRKIESGEITYQEDTYYYICEYHYVEDTPGDDIILDDMPVGGGSGTFFVLYSLGDQTQFTPIDYSTSSKSKRISTILNYIRYTNKNGGLTVNLNDIFKNIPEFSKTGKIYDNFSGEVLMGGERVEVTLIEVPMTSTLQTFKSHGSPYQVYTSGGYRMNIRYTVPCSGCSYPQGALLLQVKMNQYDKIAKFLKGQ